MLDESGAQESRADASAENATREMIALAPGEGSAVWFLGNRMVMKATAASTGGAFGLVESLIAPGAAPPMQVQYDEDEAFYVLDGELTFR